MLENLKEKIVTMNIAMRRVKFKLCFSMTKLASNGSSRNSLKEKESELSRDEKQSTSFRKFSADSLSNEVSSENNNSVSSDNDSWESDTDYEDASGPRDGGGGQEGSRSRSSGRKESKESVGVRHCSLDSGMDDGDNDNDNENAADDDYEDENSEVESHHHHQHNTKKEERHGGSKMTRCQCYELNVTLTSYGHVSICPENQNKKLQSILRAEPQIFTIITTDKKKRSKKSKTKNQSDNINSSTTSGRPRIRFNLPDDVQIPERDKKTRNTSRILVPIPSDQIDRARRTLGVLKLKITGDTSRSVPLLPSIHSSHSRNNNSLKGKRSAPHHHHHHGPNGGQSHKPTKLVAGPTFFHRTVKLVKGHGASTRKIAKGASSPPVRKVITYGDLKLKQLEKMTEGAGEKQEEEKGEDNTKTQDFDYHALFDTIETTEGEEEQEQEEKQEEEQNVFEEENDKEDENLVVVVEDENGNIEEEKANEKEDEEDDDSQPKALTRRKALGYHIRSLQVDAVKANQNNNPSIQAQKVKKTKKFPSFPTSSRSSRTLAGAGQIKVKQFISIPKQFKDGDGVIAAEVIKPGKIVNTRYRRVPSYDRFPQFD